MPGFKVVGRALIGVFSCPATTLHECMASLFKKYSKCVQVQKKCIKRRISRWPPRMKLTDPNFRLGVRKVRHRNNCSFFTCVNLYGYQLPNLNKEICKLGLAL